MNPSQVERMIVALESIAKSLDSLCEHGINIEPGTGSLEVYTK